MQPQPCTKCNSLPEDILMLACTHDLCLNCASDRLNFEMKKKQPVNSIVCQFCYERTPLDAESINELQKLIPIQNKTSNATSNLNVNTHSNLINTPKNYSSDMSNKQAIESINKYEKPTRTNKQLQKHYERNKDHSNASKIYQRQQHQQPQQQQQQYQHQQRDIIQKHALPVTTIINSKKNCIEHGDEQILYFCFDCKCQCICPECVIHGKHKDHEVKTIKKSYPIIKGQLEQNLDKIDNVIQSLLVRKNQVQKNIRSLTEKNQFTKIQIKQAFDQVRTKIHQKENIILTHCDEVLEQQINQLDKGIKSIIHRIDELKTYSSQSTDYLKKDELTVLNYYSKRWKELKQQIGDNNITVPIMYIPNNEKILASILDLMDQVQNTALIAKNNH